LKEDHGIEYSRPYINFLMDNGFFLRPSVSANRIAWNLSISKNSRQLVRFAASLSAAMAVPPATA